jgi:uroporphyrinogen-III synthase
VALRPLEGYAVGVTADRRSEEQAELLRRRGASVLCGPSIETLYLGDDDTLRQATAALIARPPDYLVATTGIGIRAWLEAAATWGVGEGLVEALRPARIVARGPKAAGAVLAAGLSTWARSATEQMEEVVERLLAEDLAGRRVAVQEYGVPSPSVSRALVAAGAEVVEVPVYRWREPSDTGPACRLVEAAAAGQLDAVTFTSAPAVHNLFAIAERAGRRDDLLAAFNGGTIAACVGPVCAAGARREGVVAPLEPPVGRLGLLVRALSDELAPRRRTFMLAGREVVVQGSAVEVDGRAEQLSPRERAVFESLAATPGAVVPRAALLARVWNDRDADGHLLEVTVGRLRRRLGPSGPAIEVKAGRGYRLVTG